MSEQKTLTKGLPQTADLYENVSPLIPAEKGRKDIPCGTNATRTEIANVIVADALP